MSLCVSASCLSAIAPLPLHVLCSTIPIYLCTLVHNKWELHISRHNNKAACYGDASWHSDYGFEENFKDFDRGLEDSEHKGYQ